MKGNDIADIKAKNEDLQKAFNELATKVYQNSSPEEQAAAQQAAAQAAAEAAGNASSGDDGVVDADYTDAD